MTTNLLVLNILQTDKILNMPPPEISISEVPGFGFIVPLAMHVAQQRLMDMFSPKPVVNNLQDMIDTSTSELIFAISGEAPSSYEEWKNLETDRYIGTLSLLMMHASTGIVGHIEHVAVQDELRKVGTGFLLVKYAQKLAIERGAKRVDLTSSASKESAQRLYQKAGFVTRDTINWRWEPYVLE